MVYAKIMVGSDGSESAIGAVRTAAEIAVRDSAEVFVATVYRQLPPEEHQALEELGVENQKELADEGRAQAIVDAACALVEDIGATAQGLVVVGDRPGEALVDVAAEHGVDLIVSGNRGMTGAKRFIIGSVPDYVVHHATCDVLIDHTT